MERLNRIQQAKRAKASIDYDLRDFKVFCSLLEIRLKEGGRKSFGYENWHEEQKQFEAERTGRDIVLKPRQIGFSTLELARDLQYAVVNPGTNVLVIGHDSDLVEQLFLTLKIFADCLSERGLLPQTKYSNKRELVFAKTYSAVRVVESGQTENSATKRGRSGTVHRLHCTELAFWGAASATLGAVMNSVADAGEVVNESTTNGAGGLFYHDVRAARDRRSGYTLHFFAWYEHDEYRKPVPAAFDRRPRDKWEEKLREKGCDDEQIAWWRSKVDDPKVGLETSLQEYPIDSESCFRSSGDQWLKAEFLDRLGLGISKWRYLAPISFRGRNFGPARVWSMPVPGRRYIVAGDVAEGVAQDGSSAHVLDASTGDTVAVWWSDEISPGDFGLVLAVLGWFYNDALVCPERNNHGHTTLHTLLNEARYPNVFIADDKKPGFLTNSATRPVLWGDLALAIAEGSASTPDAETLSECKTIIRDEDGKPRARGKGAGTKDACRDDRYVSWAIAWHLRSYATPRATGLKIKGL